MAHAETPRPTLLNDASAAEFIGVSAGTLPVWRSRRQGPAFVRIGRLVRYRREDLLAWLDARTVRPEAAPAIA